MGIPLAALAINQNQPGPLETVGKALQLKALQQQQQYQAQAQPLELQERQNQVEIQKRQMADLDAKTKAVNEWSSGNFEDLPHLIQKNGGSFNAVMEAHKSIYDIKEQAAKIAEQDATTGEKKTDTYIKNADQQAGELSAAKDVPDAELQGWALGKVSSLAQAGIMDTPHAQHLQQQIQQSQDPAAIRQSLDQYTKGIQGASKIAAQAKEAAETKKAQTEEAVKAKELASMEGGGVVGTGMDAQEARAWMKKTGGDLTAYQKYKSTLAPLAQINVAAGAGGGLTDTAKDQAAEKYWQTGVLPPGTRGAAGLVQNRAIMNRAAELHPQGSLAANSAEFKANSQALGKVQTQSDMVEAFENTAIKNLDQVLKAAESIPDVGVKFANTPIRAFESKVIGTENMARLNAALLTGRTESARVLNSANATGVLTNEARGEVEQILSGNMTYPAMKAAINQLKVDMGNRKQSYRDQISDIKGRLGGGTEAPAAVPSGGKIRARDPQGKLHEAPAGTPLPAGWKAE